MKSWILDIVVGAISIAVLIVSLIVLPPILGPGAGYLTSVVAFIVVMSLLGWKVIDIGYRSA